ncbi:MAG TPA: substrate-binding domain-containing protein, partial [Solirubrobacter sp.]|nr:substrate-binding domain-containing protein [Solirubrobacter sp.]
GLVLVPTGGALPSAAVDGVVVYSVAADDPLLDAARNLPTVIIDQPAGTGLPMVGIDDRAAAYDAARHLTDRGHRRFAIVTFALTSASGTGYDVSRNRLDGYEAALAEAGATWSVIECDGSTRALGREAAGRIDAAAVLATSDVLALGVLEERPELAVVGFDDIPEAAAAGLTTIRQDHRAKGRAAAELLLDRRQTSETLPYELIVRASSGSSG